MLVGVSIVEFDSAMLCVFVEVKVEVTMGMTVKVDSEEGMGCLT